MDGKPYIYSPTLFFIPRKLKYLPEPEKIIKEE